MHDLMWKKRRNPPEMLSSEEELFKLVESVTGIEADTAKFYHEVGSEEAGRRLAHVPHDFVYIPSE